jgi:hypothetical protein
LFLITSTVGLRHREISMLHLPGTEWFMTGYGFEARPGIVG